MAFRYFVAILAIGAVCCDALPTLGHENLGVNVNLSGIVPPCVEPCEVNNTVLSGNIVGISQATVLGNANTGYYGQQQQQQTVYGGQQQQQWLGGQQQWLGGQQQWLGGQQQQQSGYSGVQLAAYPTYGLTYGQTYGPGYYYPYAYSYLTPAYVYPSAVTTTTKVLSQ